MKETKKQLETIQSKFEKSEKTIANTERKVRVNWTDGKTEELTPLEIMEKIKKKGAMVVDPETSQQLLTVEDIAKREKVTGTGILGGG